MATRIENSRPTKRPQWVGTYSSGSGAVTVTSGRVTRKDLRGFPSTNGTGHPVVADITTVA